MWQRAIKINFMSPVWLCSITPPQGTIGDAATTCLFIKTLLCNKLLYYHRNFFTKYQILRIYMWRIHLGIKSSLDCQTQCIRRRRWREFYHYYYSLSVAGTTWPLWSQPVWQTFLPTRPNRKPTFKEYYSQVLHKNKYLKIDPSKIQALNGIPFASRVIFIVLKVHF